MSRIFSTAAERRQTIPLRQVGGGIKGEPRLEGSAEAIAVDTLSLDFGPSPDFIVHNTWLPAGRYGIEGIANLGALPARGATIVVGAPKVRGGTGGPARVFAFV